MNAHQIKRINAQVGFCWIFALALFSFSSLSLAQTCELVAAGSSQKYLTKLSILRSNGCYGESNDSTEFNTSIQSILKLARTKSSKEDAGELKQLLSEATDMVFRETSKRAGSANTNWLGIYQFLMEELVKAANSIQASEIIKAPTYWDWNNHRYFQTQDQSFRIDYRPLVNSDCSMPAADPTKIAISCLETLNETGSVIRSTALMQQILQVSVEGRLEEHHKALVDLDREWDYYFEEARSQYLWELAINARRYDAPDDKFAPPPEDQIIFLHPTVAMEYVGGGAQNERSYEVAAVIELIGYNRFKWGEDSKMKWPLGIAVVATVTPYNTGDRVGYGMMFHVNNKWSLGVIRRDTGAGDDTTWLITADLMKLILKKSEEVKKKFRFGE